MTKKILITFLFSIFFVNSYAQPSSNGNGPASLPQEIIEACKGKNEKDNCTIVDPQNKQNTVEGVCFKLPNAPTTVACLPKPPKEIVEACKDKKEGDSCSFTAPDAKKINGTCRKSPLEETEQLCIPAAPVGANGENNSKNGH